MKPYHAAFVQGTNVTIRERGDLEEFRRNWHHHHPLTPEQLAFAGQSAKVVSVSFYHGGDPLYALEGIPGMWHETCLKA